MWAVPSVGSLTNVLVKGGQIGDGGRVDDEGSSAEAVSKVAAVLGDVRSAARGCVEGGTDVVEGAVCVLAATIWCIAMGNCAVAC